MLKLASGIVLLSLMLVGITLAAQEGSKTADKTRSITGCLTKGDEANEFHLKAQDGGTWDLKSDTVKMAEHVGHTVKVTGEVSNATAHGIKESVKTGVDKTSKETGNLKVTDLSMVSESCK